MPHSKVALGWHVSIKPAGKLIYHTGATHGFRSLVAFDRERRRGAVVLTNSTYDIQPIGIRILDPSHQIPEPGKEVEVSAQILDRYVGTYHIRGAAVFQFIREGPALMVLQDGSPKLRIHPESQTTFFYKTVDAKFTFVEDEHGKVNRIVLHQHGKELAGHRIAEIRPDVLDTYVGVFRLSAGPTFQFAREGGKLMVIQTGAPKLQIYPESETKFFYAYVDAQFTFVRNSNGSVDKIILHQAGQNLPGERIR